MRANESEENLIATIGAETDSPEEAPPMPPTTGIHTPVPQTLRNWL